MVGCASVGGSSVVGEVRVELAGDGDLPRTGATTDRLLFRVTDDGEHVVFVVSGIVYELLAVRRINGRSQERAFLLEHAPAAIVRSYRAGDLLDLPRVDGDTVVVDLTEHNVPPV